MSYPGTMQYLSPPLITQRDYVDFDDAGTEESTREKEQAFGDSFDDYFKDLVDDWSYYYDDLGYYDNSGQFPDDASGGCSSECGVTSFQTGNRMAGERVIGGDKAEAASFPWVVRIRGGCTGGTVCGGTIISARLVASAFHCAINTHESRREPCDHSDGRRYAIVGAHDLGEGGRRVAIIDVRHPPGAPYTHNRKDSHDFALMVLERPLKWSAEGEMIKILCLKSSTYRYLHQFPRSACPRLTKSSPA